MDHILKPNSDTGDDHMRKTTLALTALGAIMATTCLANAANVTYACGSTGGYYCKGNGTGFADLMADKDNGRHKTTLLSTAGSDEIGDVVCSGAADAGGMQADVYALKRAEDRSFARCALVQGVIGQEAVLLAAPEGTVWGQFRKPNPSAEDGKWVIYIKEGSGATGPAKLISKSDPAIAANVSFVEIPVEEYDMNAILGDISFGDADGVLWVQKPNPNEGAMKIVNDTDGIDWVATGFQKYADEITVGNRRKAPVYSVLEMPVEGGSIALLSGNAREIPLLAVNVVGVMHSGVDAAVKQNIKVAFSDSGIAPNLTIADKIMALYNDGMSAASDAWAVID